MLLEESVAIKRKSGNLVGLATSLNNLAMLTLEEGDLDRAIAYLEETLAIDRQLGSPDGISHSLGNMASLIAERGDLPRAAALDAEALELRRDLGDRLSIAFGLESIATTASRAGFTEVGARLFGAAERLREEIDSPVPPSELTRYENGLAATQEAIPEKEFAALWAAGRALSLDDAVAEAQDVAREIANTAETPV